MARPMKLEFGEWTPDQPDSAAGATEARNVLPAARTYLPFPSLAEEGDALPAAPMGATSGASLTGDGYSVAATASGLYRRVGLGWSDVTRTAGAYTTGAEETWRFEQFGNRVLATNWSDPVQAFDLETSTDFSDLSASAPRARHMAVVREFLMLASTYDATDGERRNRLWWSAFNDPTSWPAPGSTAANEAQSDFQDIADMGAVVGIVGQLGGVDGLVFLEGGVKRLAYEGPPTVFGLYTIDSSAGCVAPGSIVKAGGAAFYLSDNGLHMINGGQAQPIGPEKVARWFARTADSGRFPEIQAVADPTATVILWAFASNDCPAGRRDKVLAYNYLTGRFSHADVDTLVMWNDRTVAKTLEELDAIFPTLDAMPIGLDSRTWKGGKLAVSAMTTAHKLARLAGLPLPATLDTTELSIPGRRVRVTGARPLIEGGDAAATVRLGYRENQTATPTLTAASAPGVDGRCPLRVNTRYARVRVEIPADVQWTHAMGVEVEAMEEGSR